MIPFHHSHYEISDCISLTIMDCPKIDAVVKSVLDEVFVSICEGESDSPLETVKKHVKTLFSQKDETWKMGAIAEFFVHLFVKLSGFKQECLFLNLEENSIKKGFDGLYSFCNAPWLMESKSGAITTRGISHAEKVKEAMSDLTKKVAGKTTGKPESIPNNPWRNAYSHANQYSVNTSESLRKWIKDLANEFTNGTYHTIEEFNTMPCGTVFLSGIWNDQDHEAICASIAAIADKLDGKKIHVICVTHASIKNFVEYISTEAENENAE